MPGETTYTLTIKKDGTQVRLVEGLANAPVRYPNNDTPTHVKWTDADGEHVFVLGPGYECVIKTVSG